ncbi:MAG: CvpA family protein, partial [Acidimicrobiia bacterium]
MFDILVGAGLALLAVRGWRRGLIREAMDFVGLVVGVFIAFRTSSYTGP